MFVLLFSDWPGLIWGNGKTPRACEECLRTSSPFVPQTPVYLSQKPPVAMESESPQMDTTASQTGASQTAAGQDETGTKRKAEQQNGTPTRTKRNRYISIAWYDPRTSDVPGILGNASVA